MSLRGNRYRRKFKRLQKAVIELYTAAFWTPDRPLPDEGQLWRDLRDAAGLDEGTKLSLLMQGRSATDDER